MSAIVLEGCTVVTMDGDRTEYATGHLVVDGSRITAVGPGPAPAPDAPPDARWIDAPRLPGHARPGQHPPPPVPVGHQGPGRGLHPVRLADPACIRSGRGLDEEITGAAATAALAWLARTGCTTSMDHHYVFPRGGGDVLGATVAAARAVGLRFHPTRGSMDLGASAGGLPPDDVVESLDEILAATRGGHRPLP